MTMRVGIHLPQYGKVASREAVAAVAGRAEELGFADVWVSDHTVHPAAQSYPSPYLFDPVVTLAWAAALTERVGLGTSVWVAPMHNPLESANTFASLDALSGGRLTIGVGVGWSADEYDALGYSFDDRGRRLDEILDLWRTVWRDDPADFDGTFTSFEGIRVRPGPAHEIPVWVGGGAEVAYQRAVERGDGFQLIGVTPEEAAPVIERLRRERPEPEFTISLRTGWDPNGMEARRIQDEYAAYEEAGVQHVVSAPWRSDLDEWLDSMAKLADLVALA
jgi:probable F420-dependent oxidoreductase